MATHHTRASLAALTADFLAAFNVNLNTTSTRRANAIAFDVREKGRIRREPEAYAAITTADVERFVTERLAPERRVTVAVVPRT